MTTHESVAGERTRLARRLQLLEIEAAVQRATLAATFEAWGRRPGLAMGSAIGAAGARLLRVPRLRWLLLASLAARLKKKHGEHDPRVH